MRLFKQYLLFILLALTCGNGFAATDCATITTNTECNSTPGCWWDDIFYNANNKCTTCANTIPDGAELYTDGLKGIEPGSPNPWTYDYKNTHTFCPWTFECPAGQIPTNITENGAQCQSCPDNQYNSDKIKIFVMKKDDGEIHHYESTNRGLVNGPDPTFTCTPCGDNATHNDNHSNCNCETGWATSTNKTNNITTDDCTKYATTTVHMYIGDFLFRYLSYAPDKGYDVNPDGDFSNDIGLPFTDYPSVNTPPDTTKEKFTIGGWSTDKEGKNLFFTSNQLKFEDNQKNINEYCAENDCDKTPNGEIILYAAWTPKKYYLRYKYGGNGYFFTHDENLTCEYTKTCLAHTPEELENYYCYYDDGYPTECSFNERAGPQVFFSHWECTDCLNRDGIVHAGRPIREPDKEYANGEITLEPVYIGCPSGYYCSDGKKYECPAGSTSKIYAERKQDCFLVGGTTRFCNDESKCITLPEGTMLKYTGQ